MCPVGRPSRLIAWISPGEDTRSRHLPRPSPNAPRELRALAALQLPRHEVPCRAPRHPHRASRRAAGVVDARDRGLRRRLAPVRQAQPAGLGAVAAGVEERDPQAAARLPFKRCVLRSSAALMQNRSGSWRMWHRASRPSSCASAAAAWDLAKIEAQRAVLLPITAFEQQCIVGGGRAAILGEMRRVTMASTSFGARRPPRRGTAKRWGLSGSGKSPTPWGPVSSETEQPWGLRPPELPMVQKYDTSLSVFRQLVGALAVNGRGPGSAGSRRGLVQTLDRGPPCRAAGCPSYFGL